MYICVFYPGSLHVNRFTNVRKWKRNIPVLHPVKPEITGIIKRLRNAKNSRSRLAIAYLEHFHNSVQLSDNLARVAWCMLVNTKASVNVNKCATICCNLDRMFIEPGYITNCNRTSRTMTYTRVSLLPSPVSSITFCARETIAKRLQQSKLWFLPSLPSSLYVQCPLMNPPSSTKAPCIVWV